jgi:hypothetical protein
MPNATVRANARTTPKSPPTKDAQVEESGVDEWSAFERAHSRWLAARSVWENPDGFQEESARRRAELERAERELILMPAVTHHMVWDKIEVLTHLLEEEAREGRRVDHFALLALAAIKTDLLRFGIGEAAQ